MDSSGFVDEKCESKLYIGNLDLRITEAALIKMFSPFGKIISEDFLWHTRGPKRGEPRGFAFIEYSSKEEAKLAKESMHGKLACSRPLVVRLASEKLVINTTNNNNTSRAAGETSKSRPSGSNYGHMSRSDKIAAIKNKLRALEGGEGERSGVKKQKQGQVSCRNNIDK
ncbi:probable RNA-binding protein 18 isoform X3 [Cucurbita moschata]|nr:probable RNA-binding protein 18 isoform X3 [Cucurbita moschata]